MNVQFSPSGERAFLEKLEYLTQQNPRAARVLVSKVEKVLRRLSRFPSSGRRIPEFPNIPYREIVLPPFRFFHRVEGNQVWIVAVWHSSQLASQPSG